MGVRVEVEKRVAGVEAPEAALALRIAALLDDESVPSRDVAGLSRELRQVLDSLDLGADVDGAVFDLEARRQARERRRA